jgi:hypothetical protein
MRHGGRQPFFNGFMNRSMLVARAPIIANPAKGKAFQLLGLERPKAVETSPMHGAHRFEEMIVLFVPCSRGGGETSLTKGYK